ncbi:hypothetical protein [Vibrio comitans]|uniref:Uncharacterized protein n=1 Tax=Vibrio comitans NBRC 102076 TaxID=1219078 RepID=A0A4Y3IQB5_9VIBR|nr:hypothetical protein [Vibrio comitans]GEA61265.1 hypothetical protein VCO01S_24580 [Vibrio comitans NBRC 102076]
MCYESGFKFIFKQGMMATLVVLLLSAAFGYLFYDLNQTILAFGDANELIDEAPITLLTGE